MWCYVLIALCLVKTSEQAVGQDQDVVNTLLNALGDSFDQISNVLNGIQKDLSFVKRKVVETDARIQDLEQKSSLCIQSIENGKIMQNKTLTDKSTLLSNVTQSRRTVSRFTRGSMENNICWNRNGADGFHSVIDVHNHFRPTGGSAVPFRDYIGWMIDSGIVFSTVFGIGAKLKKKNPNDPECCYYLHCPGYQVIPDIDNDILNAKDYRDIYMKDEEIKRKLHLTVSVTGLNLQNPVNNMVILRDFKSTFPGIFAWAGELIVFKHAFVTNDFFQGPRVTVEQIKSGALDPLFREIELSQWPVTLHCDLGCDQYDSIPLSDNKPLGGCEVPVSEKDLAKKWFRWWTNFLGPYFVNFFDINYSPRKIFKKIQHLQVWDTLLTRFPGMKVVWAHMGLSKELITLHPVIHKYILMKLFARHPNLYADISWDVLAKLIFFNYKDEKIDLLLPGNHEDMIYYETGGRINETQAAFFDNIRNSLHDRYLEYKDQLYVSDSNQDMLSGPTHALGFYLDLIHTYPDRFLTGIDFVASMGKPEEYPGLMINSTGCMKDKSIYNQQLTATSFINIFLDDEAFRKIVLGENFFKLTGLDSQYAPPTLC